MIKRHLFRVGYDDYRPVIMWFWNEAMDADEIRRQIDGFYEQRIYHFFIHPQSTFLVEYLSERFFDLIGVAIDHAKQRGMKFWIYDEYNWPSGMAAGQLLRDYPEYRMVVLRHKEAWVNQGQTITVRYDGELKQAQVLSGIQLLDVLEEGIVDPANGTFQWTNRDTVVVQLHLYSEQRQGGIFAAAMMSPFSTYQEGYLDTMNPEAVRKFLDLTHEAYYARFGEHFGDTVAGVFTDEPNLVNPFDCGPGTIPWTKQFEQVFLEVNGYELLPHLTKLLVEVGDYQRVRYDYWHTLSDRFATAYAKQTADWCREHQVLLTGHVSGEENLIADLLQTGNAFMFLQHLHVPAIDNIFSKQLIKERETFNLAGKLIVAVAEHIGADRTLCETYTGSGWDLSMEDMRKILNRLAVLGVNTIQFMGAYYSLRGLRKRMPITYPPTHNFQSPLWPYYGAFSDYASRLCYANSYGEHVAQIAILMPTTSVFSHYALRHEFWSCVKPFAERGYGDLDIVESTLHGVSNALLAVQRDFDLLHEPSFMEAEVAEGGVLKFRGHAYRQLIIPSSLALTGAQLDKLASFIRAGGRVCFVNLLPTGSPDRGSIVEEVEALTGLAIAEVEAEVREAFANRSEPYSCVYGEGSITRIASNELGMFANAGLREVLRQALAAIEQPLATLAPTPHLYVTHRRSTEADVFLIVNDDESSGYSGGLAVRRSGVAIAHDPATGASHIPLQAVGADGSLEIRLAFDVGQAWVLEVRAAEEELAAEAQQGEAGEAGESGESGDSGEARLLRAADPIGERSLELSGGWSFIPAGGDNALRLSPQLAPLAEDGEEGERSYLPVDQGYYFPPGQGFALGARYEARAVFTIEDMPSRLSLVLDPEADQEVYVNSVPVTPERIAYVWDVANQLFPLEALVRLGENEIVVRERIPDYGAQQMPAFMVLIGEFGVSPARTIIAMPRRVEVPGSWAEQGFPDFSGQGVYRTTVMLEALGDAERCELSLSGSRDAMALSVNGQPAGESLWNPHRFDITAFIRAGENELELRVSNTLANLMEHPPMKADEQGMMRPVPLQSGLAGTPALTIYTTRKEDTHA